ncbi:hypothetical protein BGW80DRAFT_1437016 [Lactifluus volemus]|nr:hypothetical protein BGW80DRAFT_1437016 [Lactifluus volemus]
MNVLIHTPSSSLPLNNLLPVDCSCALLVLPSHSLQPLSLPKPAHNAIQEYIASGGRMLGIGQGVSLLPHRPAQAQQQGRLDLWDAKSGTAIVPEAPRETSESKSTHSSIRLHTGALISGLWPAAVSFELTHANRDFASSSVLALLRYALTSLGLTVPATESSSSSGPLRELPAVPRYPLPQFLLHPHGKGHITETMLEKLGLSLTTATTNADSASLDKADTFHFHKAASVAAAPRVVIVLPPDELPPRELTPRFDIEKYFAVLAEVRGDKGVSEAVDGSSWGLGEALFYGEANQRLLTSLPTPLAGRGRGSNTWLSPEGCLQFSILLRPPFSAFPVPRLVFVQYLACLAVIQACRHSRLKWPNDVYIEFVGGEKKKIGGTLVNTSFSSGNMDIVIGCGINVCTPAPVTALSALCPSGRRLDTETVLALVLTKFERLWTTFVRGRGSWAPFEEDYLDAWMHSDQLVTLTTVNPPVSARIVGITHDHGLLRTIPERTGGIIGGGAARTTSEEMTMFMFGTLIQCLSLQY